ncbi:MAG TPA: GNAT family N-acetyltransferase, partial [Gaiellaceae bacterium]|nr:GNAT family N-acetyltransferase [Gaiellaceae bacterium]
DRAAILALFDEQMRRNVVDEDGIFAGDGWSAVLWPPADPERTVGRLRALPGHVEWKLYGHDPPELAATLRASGFEPGDEETLLCADAAAVASPEEEVAVADTPELVDAFCELAALVFGRDAPGARRELLRALDEPEPSMLATVVLERGAAVSGGRVDLPRDADFAGLFGGVTLPGHRGRGLYRATVARRAELARERGYRYLYVDALPTSRPILERLGFVALTTTTPFSLPRRDGANG